MASPAPVAHLGAPNPAPLTPLPNGAALRPLTPAALSRMSDEELLATRLSDLPLRIESTPLEARVARLYD